MLSMIDSENGDVIHGSTIDDSGTVWYWEYDGGSVEFTDRGVPVGHPIRSGSVPDDVRKAAEADVSMRGYDV